MEKYSIIFEKKVQILRDFCSGHNIAGSRPKELFNPVSGSENSAYNSCHVARGNATVADNFKLVVQDGPALYVGGT